ncbi:MAG: hypothetical protein IT434_11485 [Phycisphaerales bacterium]|nr:hypothetical protein [Phycisphaerales bacterium]
MNKTIIGTRERLWHIVAAIGFVCVTTTTTVLAWPGGPGTTPPVCTACTANQCVVSGFVTPPGGQCSNPNICCCCQNPTIWQCVCKIDPDCTSPCHPNP